MDALLLRKQRNEAREIARDLATDLRHALNLLRLYGVDLPIRRQLTDVIEQWKGDDHEDDLP